VIPAGGGGRSRSASGSASCSTSALRGPGGRLAARSRKVRTAWYSSVVSLLVSNVAV
jgi:hypothetical protein